MKKYLIAIFFLLSILCIGFYLVFMQGVYIRITSNQEIFPVFYTEKNKIFRTANQQAITIKSVDISATLPGVHASDYKATKQDYLRWFEQIAQMGGNTLRVSSLMNAEFYDALYQYNTQNEQPLYLLQGFQIEDKENKNSKDAYSDNFYNSLLKQGTCAVDIIHGRRIVYASVDHLNGTGNYFSDVSPWVIGYIIGEDWNAEKIAYTNHVNGYDTQYNGKYIQVSSQATVFETLLAKVMDHIISYETEKYGQQRLIAFANSPTTDFLEYESIYAMQLQKSVTLNPEHILPTDAFGAGQFVFYILRETMPTALSGLEQSLAQQILPLMSNTQNTSMEEQYIELTCKYHSMPVLFGYGVSTARIPLSEDKTPLTEEQQGETIVKYYRTALQYGAAGLSISSWQDSWERRSWNTSYTTVLTMNYLWHDRQSVSQNMGILAFDTVQEGSCIVDGDSSEWSQEQPVLQQEGYALYVKQDTENLYLMIKGNQLEQTQLYIPLDISKDVGSTEAQGEINARFQDAADYVVVLNGTQQTGVWVQDRYDALRANFLKDITNVDPFVSYPEKDSNHFVLYKTALSNTTLLDSNELSVLWRQNLMDENVPIQVSEEEFQKVFEKSAMQIWDAGLLVHGNANPTSKDYNSLADFCFGNGCVEIRIPWNMLNVGDPTQMQIIEDIYPNYGIQFQKVSHFSIGIGTGQDSITMQRVSFEKFPIKASYTERLKKSYAIIQKEWGQ